MITAYRHIAIRAFRVQRGSRAPAAPILFEAALGDQDVQVTVEVQVAAKRVGDDHDQQPDPVLLPGPLLQHLAPEDGKIMEEVLRPRVSLDT